MKLAFFSSTPSKSEKLSNPAPVNSRISSSIIASQIESLPVHIDAEWLDTIMASDNFGFITRDSVIGPNHISF